MTKSLISLLFLLLPVLGWVELSTETEKRPSNPDVSSQALSANTSVSATLTTLGAKVERHGLQRVSADLIEKGKEIVHDGVTTNKAGQLIRKQSKHFVCTSCHNTQVEDPDLSNPNPEARLDYAIANQLPFLQGTTFYGIVNRETWYNGDYYKKYGDLVNTARKDLREAVQLCAVECAQGRSLQDWELNAVMAYLWSLEFKLDDLNLNDADLKRIQNAKTPEDKTATADWLKSQYFTASPATFTGAYESQQASKTLKGNPERGKSIYQLSCQHCHAPNTGITNYHLDESQLTFKMLKRHLNKYNNLSIYQVSRYGTQPVPGYKPYMPQYTLERMSEQQLADLRAYIVAKGQ
ncbi:MAG: c-type cytochrome [Chitinophagales bacterium]